MFMPLLVQALFGIVSPLNKQALYLCPALLYTASKVLCAGALLFVFEWVRTRTLPRVPREQWVYYVQIIATSMENLAMQYPVVDEETRASHHRMYEMLKNQNWIFNLRVIDLLPHIEGKESTAG